jgi:death-on-curing protein
MIFLSADDISDFNDELIPNAQRPTELVEAIASRVLNAHFYNGLEDVFELAAIYLLAISTGHIFVDANKRTAFLSCALFLAVNEIELVESPDLVELTVETSQGLLTVEQIAERLRELVEPEA